MKLPRSGLVMAGVCYVGGLQDLVLIFSNHCTVCNGHSPWCISCQVQTLHLRLGDEGHILGSFLRPAVIHCTSRCMKDVLWL